MRKHIFLKKSEWIWSSDYGYAVNKYIHTMGDHLTNQGSLFCLPPLVQTNKLFCAQQPSSLYAALRIYTWKNTCFFTSFLHVLSVVYKMHASSVPVQVQHLSTRYDTRVYVRCAIRTGYGWLPLLSIVRIRLLHFGEIVASWVPSMPLKWRSPQTNAGLTSWGTVKKIKKYHSS